MWPIRGRGPCRAGRKVFPLHVFHLFHVFHFPFHNFYLFLLHSGANFVIQSGANCVVRVDTWDEPLISMFGFEDHYNGLGALEAKVKADPTVVVGMVGPIEMRGCCLPGEKCLFPFPFPVSLCHCHFGAEVYSATWKGVVVPDNSHQDLRGAQHLPI